MLTSHARHGACGRLATSNHASACALVCGATLTYVAHVAGKALATELAWQEGRATTTAVATAGAAAVGATAVGATACSSYRSATATHARSTATPVNGRASGASRTLVELIEVLRA